jgi:uncharacterized repeat protein (TIGR01451 family)
LFILAASFNGTFNYDISNNGTAAVPLVGNRQGGMIHVNKGSGTGSFSGRIQNNFIGDAAIVNSGSLEAFGIIVGTRGAGGSHTTLIDNNTVRQYEDRGIVSQAGEGAAALNATITNNTVSDFADAINSLHGIHSDNGILGADANTVCMDIRANSVATAGNEPAGGADIRLRKGPQAALTLRIPGLVGTTAAAAQAKVQADNPTATTVNVTGANFAGGAACTQPTLPAAPLPPEAPATSELSADDTRQLPTPDAQPRNILWAARGENQNPQNVISLTQSEVSAMVQAAIARWSESGISAKDFARLQSFSYEIADLPEGQLAVLKGNHITIDTTAAGHGWFFDSTPSDDNEFAVPVPNQELQTTEYSSAHGRVDLLTVLMRQLGPTMKQGKSKVKGPQSWLMENTLEPGTRRAPSFKIGQVGKVSAPKAGAVVAAAKPSAAKQSNSYQQAVSLNAPRNSRGTVRRHHANTRPAAVPTSFADVNLSIGVLPAGKSITITFNVTVDDPFPGPGAQVCNQGTVSGTNFANVLTDDPDVGGVADPTCTPIDLQADLEITAKSDSPDPVIAGNNITYTINFINNGPNASGATVTDATPAGTTFVSAQVLSGTGWGIVNPGVGNTGDVVFSKALVADDETASFEIVVKVNSSVAGGSTITNTATAATSGAADPVPGNNSKTAMTAVVAQADLSITKDDGATTEVPGTPVTYTIVVTNNGPSDANGATVSDMFPSILTGVTYTSVAAGGATGNTAAGSGNINDTVNMPAGSSITYTATGTIDPGATCVLSNTATVTAPGGVTDPNGGNNSATDMDTLPCGDPVTAVGPANVWIGLKNSDDVGTKFDLLAEVFKNGSLIGTGQLDGVNGGSSGFNNAVLRTINMALTDSVSFNTGDTLSFKLSVRIAVGVPGHSSGTARLWYNDSAADSRVNVTLSGVPTDYFLRDGFVLATTAGPGPKKTVDVLVKKAGGNPFKPFGTWSITF